STAVIALTVFAALNSVFSLAYYLPVANALFKPPNSEGARERLPLTIQLPLVVLSAALIVVGLLPDAFTWLTQPASVALINAFS
ncbi:MAG: hypothetical protein U0703_29130, partial [Anaerolineae bacterium]